ncbi:unnamed protein product [Clavelina lepadiformis]|uniref:Serine aminopeptidase S33 domain-containing protein n=1 Tax=Clavelina lepadiformis TaxID=159417 RepID=A0ABP0FTM9_CLALP
MLRRLARNSKPALAYSKVTGKKSPGVMFLPGFMSNMNGQKALALENWCKSNDHSFVRFDFHGTGSSDGPLSSIKNWIDDAFDVFELTTEGPQVLVGSSMGAFMMMQIAKRHQDRIVGMIGVAPSFYFLNTTRNWSTQLVASADADFFTIPSSYDKNMRVSRNFFDGLEEYDTQLTLSCPLHIIHGMQDDAIPWKLSLEFLQENQTSSDDIMLTLKKDSDHRLSKPEDIGFLLAALDNLFSTLTQREKSLL